MADVETGFDTYQGIAWAERAGLDPLQAVLDPGDKSGRRNALIDRIQRTALRWGFARARELHPEGFRRGVDFGCGGGRLTGELAVVAGEAWGTDRSPEMVGLAKRHVMAPERIVVWEEDGSSLPAQAFDLFVSVGVTLTPELLEVVAQAIWRLVQPGGAAVLVEQIDRDRHLTLADYERVLGRAGLTIEGHRLARRGTRSPFLAAASRLPMPARGLDALAAVEWRLAPHLGIPRGGYGDAVIIASRRHDVG